MARANIYLDDALYRRARSSGLNVSKVCQRAITAELARLDKQRVAEAAKRRPRRKPHQEG